MNRTYRTILITILFALLLLPALARTNDYGMICTIHCQHIGNDTEWENCMLQCHGGQQ